jgi:hypothetical protein
MQQELIALKREIRDLKTAQTVPSITKFYSASFTIPQNIARGFHYWTIHFEDSENPTEPITYDSYFFYVPENYDPATNTQKIVLDIPYDGTYGGETFTIYSTRPITSIMMDS